jgi:hypothetical protein
MYTRNSSASSELVVGSLNRLQRQNSTLQYQMDFLRRKLNSSDGDNVGRHLPKSIIIVFLIGFSNSFATPSSLHKPLHH